MIKIPSKKIYSINDVELNDTQITKLNVSPYVENKDNQVVIQTDFKPYLPNYNTDGDLREGYTANTQLPQNVTRCASGTIPNATDIETWEQYFVIHYDLNYSEYPSILYKKIRDSITSSGGNAKVPFIIPNDIQQLLRDCLVIGYTWGYIRSNDTTTGDFEIVSWDNDWWADEPQIIDHLLFDARTSLLGTGAAYNAVGYAQNSADYQIALRNHYESTYVTTASAGYNYLVIDMSATTDERLCFDLFLSNKLYGMISLRPSPAPQHYYQSSDIFFNFDVTFTPAQYNASALSESGVITSSTNTVNLSTNELFDGNNSTGYVLFNRVWNEIKYRETGSSGQGYSGRVMAEYPVASDVKVALRNNQNNMADMTIKKGTTASASAAVMPNLSIKSITPQYDDQYQYALVSGNTVDYVKAQILNNWSKDKIVVKVKCSIGEYYNDDGTLAISTKDNDKPMVFHIDDQVQVYLPTKRHDVFGDIDKSRFSLNFFDVDRDDRTIMRVTISDNGEDISEQRDIIADLGYENMTSMGSVSGAGYAYDVHMTFPANVRTIRQNVDFGRLIDTSPNMRMRINVTSAKIYGYVADEKPIESVDGAPIAFKVVGLKYTNNGACWQELELQSL